MQPQRDVPAVPPLLARVALGEAAAVRECLTKYGGLVWSIARRFDPADAEDAVQEIFLDLWKSAARYEASLGSEATFIATIARRRLIDRRRSRRRRPADGLHDQITDIVLEDPGVSPVDSAEAAQAAKALGQLKPEQRQVLVLSTCHGLSHGEIAAHTGMPLGTVKAHARRGLISIRAALLGVEEGQS